MTAQQPTGHDKAEEWLAAQACSCSGDHDPGQHVECAHAETDAGLAIAALRAALAAGDPNVAEALDVPSLLAAAKAEALRGAAESAAEEPHITLTRGYVARWLRERADRIENGE